MNKIPNTIWCILLLFPAMIYYLLLLVTPQKLTGVTIQSIPLPIFLGLTVMLWIVSITFIYTYTTLKTKKTDEHQ